MSASSRRRGRVEVRRRLVEDEDLGLHREHGGHGDPAALPERQVVRRAVDEVEHPDLVERIDDPRLELRAAQAGVGGPELHVVAHRRHEQLVVGVLEDHARPGVGPPARLASVTGRPDTDDRPGAGGEDAVEVEHQGGLAGAVGPEQGDAFALVHVEVDAEQGLVAVGVGVARGRARRAPAGVVIGSPTPRQRRQRPQGEHAGRLRHCAAVAVSAVGHRAASRCSRATASRGGPAPRARRSGRRGLRRRGARTGQCATGRGPKPRDSRAMRIRASWPVDDVEVAHHDGHDLHELGRQASPRARR